MSSRRNRSLTQLHVLMELAQEAIDGTRSPDELRVQTEQLVAEIEGLQEAKRRREGHTATLAIGDLLARVVRELRDRSGTKQETLAAGMVRLGFGWERSTVASVETGRRKLSFEELVGLAALFSVPVVALLSAVYDGESIVLNDGRTIGGVDLAELVRGPVDGDIPLEGWHMEADMRASRTVTGSPDLSDLPNTKSRSVAARARRTERQVAALARDWRPAAALAKNEGVLLIGAFS